MTGVVKVNLKRAVSGDCEVRERSVALVVGVESEADMRVGLPANDRVARAVIRYRDRRVGGARSNLWLLLGVAVTVGVHKVRDNSILNIALRFPLCVEGVRLFFVLLPWSYAAAVSIALCVGVGWVSVPAKEVVTCEIPSLVSFN